MTKEIGKNLLKAKKARVLITILAVIMVVSSIPSAFAQESMAVGADIYWGTTASQWNGYSNLYTSCGLSYVRLCFTPGTVSGLRSVVPAIVDDGVNVIGLLYAPQYAPDNPQAYGDWVYDVVSEFKDDVTVWEIWNEPNLNTFFEGKDPAKYTNFLKEGYTNAKAADSDCFVLGCSVAWTHSNARSFIQAVYNNGGKDYMDALSHHPYCYPYAPDAHPSNPFTDLPLIKQLMEQNGDNNHIWITELGWEVGAVTTSQQAEYLVECLEYARDWGWVDCFIVYQWKDGAKQMGLTTSRVQPRQSYYAVQDFIETLDTPGISHGPEILEESTPEEPEDNTQDNTQTDPYITTQTRNSYYSYRQRYYSYRYSRYSYSSFRRYR